MKLKKQKNLNQKIEKPGLSKQKNVRDFAWTSSRKFIWDANASD